MSPVYFHIFFQIFIYHFIQSIFTNRLCPMKGFHELNGACLTHIAENTKYLLLDRGYQNMLYKQAQAIGLQVMRLIYKNRKTKRGRHEHEVYFAEPCFVKGAMIKQRYRIYFGQFYYFTLYHSFFKVQLKRLVSYGLEKSISKYTTFN